MTWSFKRPCLWFIDFLDWHGWNHPCTVFFSLCSYGKYNWGITILPLCGWKYLGLSWRLPRKRREYVQGRWRDAVRPNKRRFILGLWFVEIFFDHAWHEGDAG